MKDLSSRQQSILNRVVETHIETAHPVGSRAITRLYTELYSTSYSPATVRHEMGLLEEMGFLTHPHTSAGRVPTDRGYRYYVDHGLCPEDLSGKVSDSLGKEETGVWEETNSFAERVSKALSALSEETSLVFMADPPSQGLEKAKRFTFFLQGSSHILEKPEFQDVEKIRALFRAFEEKSELMEWLRRRSPARKGVFITIGHENEPEALQDCAIVSTDYYANGVTIGTIAVLGPKRMRYARAVPLVEQMARWMGRVLHGREASIQE